MIRVTRVERTTKYFAECEHCYCEIECDKEDLLESSDSEGYHLECPVCHNNIPYHSIGSKTIINYHNA